MLTEEGVKATADPERASTARPLEENFMMFFYTTTTYIYLLFRNDVYCDGFVALHCNGNGDEGARNGLPS